MPESSKLSMLMSLTPETLNEVRVTELTHHIEDVLDKVKVLLHAGKYEEVRAMIVDGSIDFSYDESSKGLSLEEALDLINSFKSGEVNNDEEINN